VTPRDAVPPPPSAGPGFPRALRGAADEIVARLLPGPAGVVLDFDGTLTEIVPDPDAPVLSEGRRHVLRDLVASPELRVAVLSGRARADVARRVGVSGLAYVGNHGLEMDGWTAPGVADARPALTAFLEELRSAAPLPFPIRVEDKGATATVHLAGTRDPAVRDALLAAMDRRLTAAGARGPLPPLRLSPGKASVEVRPRVDWDKAAAFRRILEGWDVPPDRALYAGDDVTDECVFAGVPEAVGIKVGEGPTGAAYRAASPSDVVALLRELAHPRPRGPAAPSASPR
jgi:trehalose 6-phosphate phosphatase